MMPSCLPSCSRLYGGGGQGCGRESYGLVRHQSAMHCRCRYEAFIMYAWYLVRPDDVPVGAERYYQSDELAPPARLMVNQREEGLGGPVGAIFRARISGRRDGGEQPNKSEKC